MNTTLTGRRTAGAALAVGLTLAMLVACGDDGGVRRATGPAAVTAAAGDVALTDRAVGSFELYVTASAQNNPLFADVYAITVDPLQAHRITANKRISTLAASPDHVAVAAADDLQPDRLAFVTDGGELEPVPGLGRPYGYTPAFIADGGMLYRASTGSGPDTINRYDPSSESSTKLFPAKEGLFGLSSGPRGSVVQLRNRVTGDDAVVIRGAEGTRQTFTLDGDAGQPRSGTRWIAVPLYEPDSEFGNRPRGLTLIDPQTGRTKEVPGWTPITWTPDGTRLLARATDSTTDTRLALLDPANPATAEPVGTIPGLVIYQGAWVDRTS